MARGTGGGGHGAADQRWGTIVRNNVHTLVACDFCVAVTAMFRILCVFVALEVGSRRLVHVNATNHPTTAWTLERFQEVLATPHAYRFALHDRDAVYSPGLDAAVTAMAVRVLRTPLQAHQANGVL